MIVEPWIWAIVLRTALDLSATHGPRGRAAAFRGAVFVLVLADTAAEARIVLAVAREESGFDPWARNDHCADSGAPLICCGVGQVAVAGAHAGAVCGRLGALDGASWAAALGALRASARACGPTWARALTSYVSGRCGVAEDVARARCVRVGLCDVAIERDARAMSQLNATPVRW